jgi:hypothetical protein
MTVYLYRLLYLPVKAFMRSRGMLRQVMAWTACLTFRLAEKCVVRATPSFPGSQSGEGMQGDEGKNDLLNCDLILLHVTKLRQRKLFFCIHATQKIG